MDKEKGTLTLPREQLVGIVLFVQDWPGEPPDGSSFALDIFKSLNPEAFDLLARFPVDASVEVQNLRLSAQEFLHSCAKLASELCNYRFPTCSFVCQPQAVMEQSQVHHFLLCSFFRADKQAIVLLKPGYSFKLK